jgi:hypothetical protein
MVSAVIVDKRWSTSARIAGMLGAGGNGKFGHIDVICALNGGGGVGRIVVAV